MATLKGIIRSPRGESLSKGIMVDTVRGVLRIRKWPKKRGTPTSPRQLWWIDWFRQANKLAKYVDAASARRAIDITANSGMYPRDIILSAMRGRLYTWVDQTGKVWHSMAAIQDISESLDVLAQTVSDVLVRAVDRWRPAEPREPAAGQVLTSQGPGLPPGWALAGTGVSHITLPGTPIVVDGTQNEYVLDVTPYASVDLVLDAIFFAAADRADVRLSVDGGATFKSGANDYHSSTFSPTSEISGADSSIRWARRLGTLGHNCLAEVTCLRHGQPCFRGDVAYSIDAVGRRFVHMNFDGPVTHLKLFAANGNNFASGTIRATGLLSV